MTASPFARMTVAVTRLPTLDRPAFQAYWRERHGPLVRRLAETLGIVRYVQLHADLEDDGPAGPGSQPWSAPCDGLAQIWYASREAFDARMAEPAAREAARLLRDDELRFMDRQQTRRWWGVEHLIL